MESPLSAPARFYRAPTPRYRSEQRQLKPSPRCHLSLRSRSSRIVARIASSKLTEDRRERGSVLTPEVLNRTHRCLPLDGVLPHPPTVYAAPPFHPYLLGSNPRARSSLTQILHLPTQRGSHSYGDKIMVLMTPIPNPSRGDQGAANVRPPPPPAILTLTPDRTCSPTLNHLPPFEAGTP